MALKTLLFDMGNVLVFFSHQRMCAQIAAVCGVDAEDVRRQVFDSQLQWDFERGRMSEARFHEELETIFDRPIDLEALRVATADIFELNTSIVPVLDRLKRLGLRLVLMSNTCITHYEWVRSRYDVLDRFDALVLSYDVGAIKPEEEIYRAALERIQCSPDECFYTDDIATYVERGRAHGLHAEVFTDTATLLVQLAGHGIRIE